MESSKQVKTVQEAYLSEIMGDVYNIKKEVEEAGYVILGIKNDIAGITTEIDTYVMKVTNTFSSSETLISNKTQETQENFLKQQEKYLESCVGNTNDLIQAILRTFVSETQKEKEKAKQEIAKAAVNAENSFKINKLLIYALCFSISSSLIMGIALYIVTDTFIVPHATTAITAAVIEQLKVQQDIKKSKK